MIARLLKGIVALYVSMIIAAVLFFLQGSGLSGVGLALGWLFLGPAAVLVLEFWWMHAANRSDRAPCATTAQLVAAWAAEATSMLLVFFWRVPFRHRTWRDSASCHSHFSAPERGVLLVHGYVCNRGIWSRWLARLHSAGISCLAIDLEPPFGSIDNYRGLIATAVETLTRVTGKPPLVVAHSMGGLAVRAWWVEAPPSAIHHLLTLGTPHGGTRLARMGFTVNARQMREQSAWLTQLDAQEGMERRARSTCFYSHCDNIVFPASRATLAGARNIHLPATAHLAMVDHPAAWRETLDLLRT